MQPKLNTFLIGLIALSLAAIAFSLIWMTFVSSTSRYQPVLQPNGRESVIIVDTKTGRTYVYKTEKRKLELVDAYNKRSY